MATQQAIWKNTIIAESDRTIVVERNHYFPLDSVQQQHLQPSDRHTVCVWKGTASYYDVVVDGERNRDAAWYYPDPSRAASRIAGHVAFWHGVRIRRVPDIPAAEPAGAAGHWLRRLLRSAQSSSTANTR